MVTPPAYWPTCGRCGAPVQRMERRNEPDGGATFIAYCHGAAERTYLSRSLLLDGPLVVAGGVAFAQGRAPAP